MLPYRVMAKSKSAASRKNKDDFPKPKHAKILARKIGYRGSVYTIVADKVKEPQGVTALREIIRHHGSVVVLPVDDSVRPPRVLLIRQYRYAADEYLWELPAGHIDPGEEAAKSAKRELLEETGLSAKRWKRALHFFVSPGILDETMTVFLATGLTEGTATSKRVSSLCPKRSGWRTPGRSKTPRHSVRYSGWIQRFSDILSTSARWHHLAFLSGSSVLTMVHRWWIIVTNQ
jgi:ADP-ribose pyrophosphatase